MKLWTTLNRAIVGWQMIVRGHPGWLSQFTISLAGLATALFIFAFVAFLAVTATSMSIGMPGGFDVLSAMVVLALPIISLLATVLLTRRFINSQAPVLPVFVPGIYAITAFLLLEGLLALIGGPIVMLAWFGAGYLLFRLARVALGWSIGIAIGFAVLTVVLLAAMRLTLYMGSSAPL
ncbi:MAG: hypothetical protein MO852_07500 [Candidatus Devosia euplotis]|nr:hypothetical protein [Candidatus Devosia euplotis]